MAAVLAEAHTTPPPTSYVGGSREMPAMHLNDFESGGLFHAVSPEALRGDHDYEDDLDDEEEAANRIGHEVCPPPPLTKPTTVAASMNLPKTQTMKKNVINLSE